MRGVHLAFTAHSIPTSMADNCSYQEQLQESCRLVALELGIPPSRYRLVYQSRSGRPQDPWLEPDILDHLRSLKKQGAAHVIIHPIGFLSDHMEVLYDLDEEAKHLCEELGLSMVRSRTVGTHRGFVRMLRELIEERVSHAPIDEQRSSGQFGPSHDTCPVDCCLPPASAPRLPCRQPRPGSPSQHTRSLRIIEMCFVRLSGSNGPILLRRAVGIEENGFMASRRILLVEDSSTMRRMLAMMLKEEGFDVKTANDGRKVWPRRAKSRGPS